jgi:hypothetical protein
MDYTDIVNDVKEIDKEIFENKGSTTFLRGKEMGSRISTFKNKRVARCKCRIERELLSIGY